jgi:hypothetical protein
MNLPSSGTLPTKRNLILWIAYATVLAMALGACGSSASDGSTSPSTPGGSSPAAGVLMTGDHPDVVSRQVEYRLFPLRPDQPGIWVGQLVDGQRIELEPLCNRAPWRLRIGRWARVLVV